MAEDVDALVIGGGPAGLMAAEALGRAGRRVVLTEAMPTVGRKFLMAGKSGLNLTNEAPANRFLAAYAETADRLAPMLDAFGPNDVKAWAQSLGQDLFSGSTGRVFPVTMKASPLLRAWLARLDALGMDLRPRWRWTSQADGLWTFDTTNGLCDLRPRVVVLAAGGASWRRLGSDGRWAEVLGLPIAPFQAANAGVAVSWSKAMTPLLGQPVKGVRLTAGGFTSRGEFVISARGLEGGGIYAVSRGVREGACLYLDLLPDRDSGWIAGRLARAGKASIGNRLRKALGLDRARAGLVLEFVPRPVPEAGALAALVKALPVPTAGLRPLDEAISTAGGLPLGSLDERLMLHDRPGVFAAGEMLDWEAPTGGYLLTACLATGLWAGRNAAEHR